MELDGESTSTQTSGAIRKQERSSDFADRSLLTKALDYINASIIKDGNITPHLTGIYLQEIPIDPLTGLASIDYKSAEERGWFKVDLLNLSIYENVESEEHLDKLLAMTPDWDLLKNKHVVENLFHIKNHYKLVKSYSPSSVEELAMVIALVRPGKKHLIGMTFDEMKDEIWVPTEEYYFKKAHSISYALAIVVQMNLMKEAQNG